MKKLNEMKKLWWNYAIVFRNWLNEIDSKFNIEFDEIRSKFNDVLNMRLSSLDVVKHQNINNTINT